MNSKKEKLTTTLINLIQATEKNKINTSEQFLQKLVNELHMKKIINIKKKKKKKKKCKIKKEKKKTKKEKLTTTLINLIQATEKNKINTSEQFLQKLVNELHMKNIINLEKYTE